MKKAYKSEILQLRSEGKTYKQIVEIVGCAKSTVSYYCKSYSLDARTGKYSKKLCLNCGAETSNAKYCGTACQHKYQYKDYIRRWKAGEECGYVGKKMAISQTLRRYILDKYSSSCRVCGWNKLHTVDKLPLVEINHIDGDDSNCAEDNLEVLCPNCHSMTYNYKSRNKNSARNYK